MRRLAAPLVAAIAVGTIGIVAGHGTYAALSRSTSNPGDSVAAGTVRLTDDDGGTTALTLSSARPGDTTTSCIGVTSAGSLDSTVRIYGTSTGSLPAYLTLVMTRGTIASPSFPSCAGFTADATSYTGAGAGVIYSGTLSSFPASAAAGIVDPTAGGTETWTTGERHVYKMAVTLGSSAAAQGLSGTATITWEARSS